ncbi:protein Jumonji-like isoform X2 [Panonychus citri]|uniref:protein Jumonji-like isoform X2 n=1 Tax=Panonychus citri TaxID=50023 RepID=UPI0023076CA4|nr:protein Jumonji-like isoform X2 [Panonychus citri]
MANTRSCRPKRYAAQRAQTFFSQEQTSALFYKEQNDLKKALRRSLIEARRAASRAERSEGSISDVKELDHNSDQSDQSRPKRFAAQKANVLFSQEQTSALFYKEQNDIKKAVRRSLIEARRAASRADRNERVSRYSLNGHYKEEKARSEDSEGHEQDEQHCNGKDSIDSTTSSKSKKLKVHAQRKFASSSVNNISASSPAKSDSKNYNNTVAELFPRNRPSTEDFLTFLCFRSTKLLPQINGITETFRSFFVR